jgi:hypothetical protein
MKALRRKPDLFCKIAQALVEIGADSSLTYNDQEALDLKKENPNYVFKNEMIQGNNILHFIAEYSRK